MITKLGMPKWGLSMTEGKVLGWLVEVGEKVDAGEGLAEVETEKIAGEVEAPASGVLRRRLAQVGKVYPVGALLGVIADESESDGDIDAFVADFQATFVPEEAADEAAGPTEQTVEVAGRRLRYLTLGTGEGGVPALLLHGFGGDVTSWLFNQEALAAGRPVYAVDLPGHGQSSKDVDEGFPTLAQSIVGFLDAVGVDRAHLVGHSLGGALASGVALSHPDRVASLALVASGGLGPDGNDEYFDRYLAANRRREMKPVMEMLFADPSLVTRQSIDDVLKYKRLDGVEQALRTLRERIFPDGRWSVVFTDELAAASVPILVIWGGQDRILPVAHAQALGPRFEVEILEGCGHLPHIECAGEVNRLIAQFWARL